MIFLAYKKLVIFMRNMTRIHFGATEGIVFGTIFGEAFLGRPSKSKSLWNHKLSSISVLLFGNFILYLCVKVFAKMFLRLEPRN